MSNRKRLPKPPPGPTVAVGYVHEDTLDYSFFASFVRLLAYDASNNNRIADIVARRGTTGDLAAGRNAGVSDFLAGQAQWLWWIDTDMGFAPDSIDRLLEAADPAERPVMGGLCFGQREYEQDGVGGFRPVAWPTVMDWNVIEGRGGFEVRWDYPRETVTRCTGTGSACILIHRSVFERMRDEYERIQVERGLRRDGDPRWDSWYTRVANPTTGELMGEDLSFCSRLMRLEIPLHVHTGVQTTHRKNIWLQEQDYWRQRALQPAPEAVEDMAPADRAVPRYAIIPTHNRPDRLLALVASLGKQVDHIVVLDNASDPPVDWSQLASAALPAVVEVIRDPEQPPNLARFWNVMFDHCLVHARGGDCTPGATLDPYDVGVFNDDAIVPAGWFDICSTVLRGHETAAVAHTGTSPVHHHELISAYPYPRDKRMCPWAFVVRGEVHLRADESMRWWFFDDDFNRQAIDAGGVLAAPGPLVINAHAVQSTTGVLAEQAEADRKTFEAKWSA